MLKKDRVRGGYKSSGGQIDSRIYSPLDPKTMTHEGFKPFKP